MAFPTNVSQQTTTSASLAFQLITFYEKVGLERLLPRLRYAQFAEKKPLPKGSGQTVQWYRFRVRASVKTNLTEMQVPSLSTLSADTLTATLFQRGAYVALSDLITMTAINPLLKTAAAQMGEEAARSVDTYVRDVISPHILNFSTQSAVNFDQIYGDTAPTTGKLMKIWSGFSQDGTTAGWRQGFPVLHNKARIVQSANLPNTIGSCALSVLQVMHAAQWLRSNDAMPFDDGKFVGIIHPDVSHQLFTNVSWKSWHQYTTPEAMFRGEIGEIGGVRFVETTDAPKTFLSADKMGDTSTAAVSGSAYFTTIFGKHAYGMTEIDGGFKVYVNEAGSAGAADPLHQINTVGWKVTLGVAVLNKSAGVHVISNSVDTFGC